MTVIAGSSSGFRIVARARLPGLLPAQAGAGQWLLAHVLPGYSGGTATESHRVPFPPASSRTARIMPMERGHVNRDDHPALTPVVPEV
jgi:hypothetical protein